jgi:GNAT superfamily N-acetyltransferase
MVTVVDATAERWEDLVAIFGQRGDPPGCWCQWFQHDRPGFYATSAPQRRAALQQQFAEPVPPGVLAYDDAGTPAGWCAIAPRADYQRLRTYPMAVTQDADGLWAVTCFVVRVGYRRKGLAEFLLDGAIDLARRHGARTIEAYPVDTSIRKAMAYELRHGPLSVFLRAGFHQVGDRPAPARPVVRRAV